MQRLRRTTTSSLISQSSSSLRRRRTTTTSISTAQRRGLSTSTSTSTSTSDKIVASVLFERLPVVIPKIDPIVYAFQEFSFRWGQQFRRRYPDEVLGKSDSRGQGDYHIDFVPGPRITEADKTNDKSTGYIEALLGGERCRSHLFVKGKDSLERALDRRLYLLLFGTTYGSPGGKPVWHFPEKLYETEETLRKCAESALKSVIGDLSHTYFVGNAPFAHTVIQPTQDVPDIPSFKRFFFKSQVIATNKFKIGKCEDHVWVTKDELMEYFPEKAAFLNQAIIS